MTLPAWPGARRGGRPLRARKSAFARLARAGAHLRHSRLLRRARRRRVGLAVGAQLRERGRSVSAAAGARGSCADSRVQPKKDPQVPSANGCAALSLARGARLRRAVNERQRRAADADDDGVGAAQLVSVRVRLQRVCLGPLRALRPRLLGQPSGRRAGAAEAQHGSATLQRSLCDCATHKAAASKHHQALRGAGSGGHVAAASACAAAQYTLESKGPGACARVPKNLACAMRCMHLSTRRPPGLLALLRLSRHFVSRCGAILAGSGIPAALVHLPPAGASRPPLPARGTRCRAAAAKRVCARLNITAGANRGAELQGTRLLPGLVKAAASAPRLPTTPMQTPQPRRTRRLRPASPTRLFHALLQQQRRPTSHTLLSAQAQRGPYHRLLLAAAAAAAAARFCSAAACRCAASGGTRATTSSRRRSAATRCQLCQRTRRHALTFHRRQ